MLHLCGVYCCNAICFSMKDFLSLKKKKKKKKKSENPHNRVHVLQSSQTNIVVSKGTRLYIYICLDRPTPLVKSNRKLNISLLNPLLHMGRQYSKDMRILETLDLLVLNFNMNFR